MTNVTLYEHVAYNFRTLSAYVGGISQLKNGGGDGLINPTMALSNCIFIPVLEDHASDRERLI